MNAVETSQEILKELAAALSQVDPAQADALLGEIKGAHKIFVAGTGRSLLMVRALAMRLMHFGWRAFVVGETVTPAIQPGDLLIIGSGSGETATLVAMAHKAKKVGARLALITIFPESTLGKLADRLVRIPATSSKSAQPQAARSVQPGANQFEQSLLVLCDALVMCLVEGLPLEQTNARLMQTHANLE